MNGEVKFFNESKGFGFIIGEDDKDYFVHKTDVSEGDVLDEKVLVTFDTEQGPRGRRAKNVSVREE